MPFHSEITGLLFMVTFLSPYALWAPKCHIYIMHLRAWDCAGLNRSLWFELNDTHLHYLAEVIQMKRVGKSKTSEISASFISSFCFLIAPLIYGAVRYIFPAGHWFQLSLSGTSNTVCQAQFKLNRFWCHLPPHPPETGHGRGCADGHKPKPWEIYLRAPLLPPSGASWHTPNQYL